MFLLLVSIQVHLFGFKKLKIFSSLSVMSFGSLNVPWVEVISCDSLTFLGFQLLLNGSLSYPLIPYRSLKCYKDAFLCF